MLANGFSSRAGFVWLPGLAAWVLTVVLLQPGWLPALFLWAPLVLLPLAFRLLGRGILAEVGQFCALLLPLAFLGEQGVSAGVWTLPWLAFALAGVVGRLVCLRTDRDVYGLTVWCYLLVGTCWLTLARFGARPLGFSNEIVLATAVHFHYAGFVLPILARQTARKLVSPAFARASWGILTGVPLVAAGITLSVFEITWVECLATWFLAAVCLRPALALCRLAFSPWFGAARWLGLLSGASLAIGMVLAVVYATSHFLHAPLLDIAWMLRTHGLLQAFGFALPGLLAWNLAERATAPTASVGMQAVWMPRRLRTKVLRGGGEWGPLL